MARGSRLVDRDGYVQNVKHFYVADNDVIREIQAGYIARNGVICQFWPSTMPADPSPIVMATTDLLSRDVKKIEEGQPRALIEYHAYDGKIKYSTETGLAETDGLAPQPRSTGQYLFRIDDVGGNLESDDPDDQIGVWLDIYLEGSLGIKSYYVANRTGVPSLVTGQATLRLAKDNGAGAPEAGTEVSRTINFEAELTGNNFSLSTNQWSLKDSRINEPAITKVSLGPDGIMRGYEGATVAQQEVYAQNWNPNFTVQVDVVSGAVVGTTGTELSTDQLREWSLTANVDGQDLTAVIDVTVSDNVRSVTKRVTLNSVYGAEDATTALSDDFTVNSTLRDQFLQSDPDTPLRDVSVSITVNSDGTITALENGVAASTFPQNWNESAPSVSDPQNFEVQLVRVSGDDVSSGPARGIWHNLSSVQTWGLQITVAEAVADPFDTLSKLGQYELSIREVGRPTTVKTKQLTMNVLIFEFNTA